MCWFRLGCVDDLLNAVSPVSVEQCYAAGVVRPDGVVDMFVAMRNGDFEHIWIYVDEDMTKLCRMYIDDVLAAVEVYMILYD